MSVSAPPRPPRPRDPVDRDELDALVREARRRARRRRLLYAAVAVLGAAIGLATLSVIDRSARSQGSPAAGRSRVAPAVSGSRIAFMRTATWPGGQWAVYVMNADGTGVRTLASNSGGPAWSPDGRRIAFGSEHNGTFSLIEVMAADGGARRTLVRGESFLAWSPDGKTVAFGRQKVDGFEIYATNLDRKDVWRLASKALNEGIAWSPDGRKLAFVRSAREDGSDVYFANTDGSGTRRLTSSAGFKHHPAWSPDGKRIAFTRTFGSNDGWPADIYVMNTDGSGVRRLTGISRAGSLEWSPDGSRLLFVGDRSYSHAYPTEGDGIYVVNSDGGGIRRLTANVGKEPSPAWSPDGRRIAFTGRGESIYVIGADGHGMKRLTHARQMIDWAPAWSPGKSS